MMLKQIRRLKRQRMFYILSVTFVLLLLYWMFPPQHEYESKVIIKNTSPIMIWNFVADFNNMRLLNPTITDFTIIADHGDRQDWQYSVRYIEKLSQWPHWRNVATAHISVKKLDESEGGHHVVDSKHETCFWMVFCFKSIGRFMFQAVGDDTLCREKVQYKCPLFLGSFCRTEVAYQRNAIMKNLSIIFA